MKLLGFITGMALIGGLGAWYMQQGPLSWPPLTEATAPPRADSPPAFNDQAPEKRPADPTPEASEQERLPAAETPPAPPPERPALQLPSLQELDPEAATAAPAQPRAGPTAPSEAAATSETSPSWQVFWQPFRTELSAQGFARRLRETTGLEIKVDQAASNKYLILFPYTNEEERQQHIELIEDRTSLKLKLSGQ